MLAATLAEGHTIIRPAAQEPEVDDLIAFLQKMGAEVERTYPTPSRSRAGAGCAARSIDVIPDRIEAGTFVVAAAVTGGRGDARVGAVRPPRAPSSRRCSRVGVGVDLRHGHDRGRRLGPRTPAAIRAVRHRDRPVPGPRHGPPAADGGAPDPGDRHLAHPRDDLRGPPRVADRGPPHGRRRSSSSTTPPRRRSPGGSPLHGAEVEIGDLRAGASLILAALAAEGTTTIHGAHHVHRGYENIEGKFLDLGARIERLAEGNDATSS